MKYSLTNQLAILFNWTGQKGIWIQQALVGDKK
jgi:hypothetical protein